MRTLVKLVVLVGLGAAVVPLVFAADPPAPAAAAAAPAVPPAPAWEYKIVSAAGLAPGDAGLLATINKLGADGWELAAAVAPVQISPLSGGFAGSGGFGQPAYLFAPSGTSVYAGPPVPDPGPAWAAASRGRATINLRDAEHADLRKRLGFAPPPPEAPLPPGGVLGLSPMTREQFVDLWNRFHRAAGPSVPADTVYHFKRPRR